MAAITTLVAPSGEWRYEVKVGMVSLQCNNCVIHTWVFQRRASHNGALYKSSFLYFFPVCLCVGLRCFAVSRSRPFSLDSVTRYQLHHHLTRPQCQLRRSELQKPFVTDWVRWRCVCCGYLFTHTISNKHTHIKPSVWQKWKAVWRELFRQSGLQDLCRFC